MVAKTQLKNVNTKVKITKEQAIADYRTGWKSRYASLIGRREVLTGKAKFGIFGDGKELPQLALAKHMKAGDFRSGYYRDQTIAFATGMMTVREFFAQLYATAEIDKEPASGGRMMNGHFGTRLLDEEGNWTNQLGKIQSTSDISPTAGQMPRSLGVAYASKVYRNVKEAAAKAKKFTNNGEEVSFVTIGNASTSEGGFYETVNAAGVLQVPLVVSVWDDGYGISVPSQYHTTKESISECLKGMQSSAQKEGIDIHVVKGWDYEALLETYLIASENARHNHIPSLVHVIELTQPQGHSTSGSHERYKTKERIEWEKKNDCLTQFRKWLIDKKYATPEELDSLEKEDKAYVEAEKKAAWEEYTSPIKQERDTAVTVIKQMATDIPQFAQELDKLAQSLSNVITLNRKAVQSHLKRAVFALKEVPKVQKQSLLDLVTAYKKGNFDKYNSLVTSSFTSSPMNVPEVKAQYTSTPESVDGRLVLNRYFHQLFNKRPEVFAIGEDIGALGGVNQVFENLQQEYGLWRVTDTGIRENTILGQGLGAAVRGLRPIVDIQYLDYIFYCLQTMSDDLSTLLYRTRGGQKAPVIIRTKGHRLEGIWHSGSYIAPILHGCRGLHVLVPRNMIQAAGFYNTLIQGDDPALVIEVLNGYRLKENLPSNLDSFTVPLGKVETLREGHHITVVTYGALCRIALEAANTLQDMGIDIEIIDVQSLAPFDLSHDIVKSLQRTNAVLCLDEDVPGGTAAYMLQKILEEQSGWEYLDAGPKTLSAREHRPAYGSDGDYFSKPNAEDIVETCYGIMSERQPQQFPKLF